MSQAPVRTFNITQGIRKQVPLFIAAVGAPGSGKTYSAMRLATGIVRVVGGKIGVADTENKRALHYAPKEGEVADPKKGTFDFMHVDFEPPHGPLDFLAVVQKLHAAGCKVAIFDSTTHEHSGIGGVLEQQAEQVEVLAERWKTSADKVQASSWNKPKTARRKFINTLVQLDMICIFCFRAKKGTDFKAKGEAMDLGWVPEGGHEIFYEMMLSFLLPPRSGGVPDWSPKKLGEVDAIKLPRQFEAIFADRRPIDERHGEELARWAMGGSTTATVQPPVQAQPTPTPMAEQSGSAATTGFGLPAGDPAQAPAPAPAAQPAAATTEPKSKPKPIPADALFVTGPVEETMEKTGVTNDKPWKKIGFKIGGQWFGTFDTEFEEYFACKGKPSPVKLFWKQDGNYKTVLGIEFAPEVAATTESPI